MIHYDRPAKPHGFDSDAARVSAANTIRTAVAAKLPVASADFVDVWGKHKRTFSDAQGHGKCGFCEARVTASSPGDVEHYRPKAELKDAVAQGTRTSAPRRRDRTRKFAKPMKPGYWWLAYSWGNWLFACTRCNSSWKGNQFPVVSPRTALAEGCEAQEQPLLLNPYDDKDPEARFRYLGDGDVLGLDDRARASIDICGLDRWDLVDERGRVAQALLRTIADFSVAVAEGSTDFRKSVLRHLARACSPEAQFAGMARRLVDAAPELGGLTAREILTLNASGRLN